ncbi:T9SS C-terminal target domain-containing protein, partial [candidate division KSB1 bacterium]
FADFDNDGSMDVVGGRDYGEMFMLHHDTGGPWTLLPLGDIENASGLAVADLDRDGDPDIAAALFSTGQILWGEQTPAGLVEHVLTSTMNQARDVGIADFNGDLRPDIIATAQNGNVRWWRNEGGGEFTQNILQSGSSLYGLHIADFDRDGDLDVFTADLMASEVVLFRNLMGVPGWIEGTVLSATGGLPVSGVLVRLMETGASRFTDTNGRFMIATLPDTYRITASHACWNESIQADVTVVVGDTTTSNFFLTRPLLDLGVSSINLMAPNHQLTETTLPVQNQGDGPLRITVKTRGAYPNDDWLFVTPDSVDIPAGTGVAFSVQIRPDTINTAGWDYYGQIILATNACPDSIVTVGVGIYVYPLDAPEPNSPLPERTALHAVYPNPFNSTAMVRFDLATPTAIELKMFDVTGRLVRVITSGHMAAGQHTARLEAGDLASGVYVLALRTEAQSFSEKVLLIR